MGSNDFTGSTELSITLHDLINGLTATDVLTVTVDPDPNVDLFVQSVSSPREHEYLAMPFTPAILLGNPGSSQWTQDDWLNIPSTDKAARINVWGSVSGYLISPLFNVPSEDYVLSLDAAVLRYNQTPDGTPPNYSNTDDRFAILIGDGFSWTTANIVREYNNAGSPWVLHDIPRSGETIQIPLTGYSGHIRVAIFAGSTTMDDDNDVMVNNFRIGLPEIQLPHPFPTMGLDPVSGMPVLDWAEVPGASIYHIYKANDPYGDYQFLDSISGTQYYPAAADSKAFFKITAE